LRSVEYDNASHLPDVTDRIVSYIACDGEEASASATVTVTIVSVNDPPTVTAGGVSSFLEGGGEVYVDTDVAVDDVDDDVLYSAAVIIVNPQDGEKEVLDATAAGVLRKTYNAGILTLTGPVAIGDMQEALRSVTYYNGARRPGDVPRIISYVVSDGTDASAPTSATVIVIPDRGTPMIDLNGPAPNTEYATRFTEGAGPVNVASTSATVNDSDSIYLTSLVATLVNRPDGPDESLMADNSGAPHIGVAYSSATGVLLLSGLATTASYQMLLQTVQYDNASLDPSQEARRISFTACDGTTVSPVTTSTVSVYAVNTSPSITAPTVVVDGEDTPFLFGASGGSLVEVADPDIGNNQASVTLHVVNGTADLGTTEGLKYVTGNGTADIAMRAPLSGINSALSGLRFNPSPHYSGSASLEIEANDLGHTGAGGALRCSKTISIQVIAVADAPNLSADDVRGMSGHSITLRIASSLVDTDGSEFLSIVVSGVPDGGWLSAGVNQGGGVWAVDPPDLGRLQFAPPAGAEQVFALTVAASATEISNNDTASTTRTFTVTVEPDMPASSVETWIHY